MTVIAHTSRIRDKQFFSTHALKLLPQAIENVEHVGVTGAMSAVLYGSCWKMWYFNFGFIHLVLYFKIYCIL